MARCGITTAASLLKILADLPEGYLVGTNRVGNLAVYKPGTNDGFLQVGYIELWNAEYLDGPCPDAEYTPMD
jgi:hypothetical protein